MTIVSIVEDIEKIKEHPTTTRHKPTVYKSFPKEYFKYFNTILRFVPMNFPFKKEKVSFVFFPIYSSKMPVILFIVPLNSLRTSINTIYSSIKFSQNVNIGVQISLIALKQSFYYIREFFSFFQVLNHIYNI